MEEKELEILKSEIDTVVQRFAVNSNKWLAIKKELEQDMLMMKHLCSIIDQAVKDREVETANKN